MMKNLGNDQFSVGAGERLAIDTQVNKPPFLAAFQEPPTGGSWQNVSHSDLGEHREFRCGADAGDLFAFNVACDEAIASDDPDPVARYTLKFTSITNPGDPSVTANINVPKDAGPVPRFFTFTVS
jgi:hypothetical protein